MTRDEAKNVAWQTIRADFSIIQQVIKLIDRIYDSIEEEKQDV